MAGCVNVDFSDGGVGSGFEFALDFGKRALKTDCVVVNDRSSSVKNELLGAIVIS